MEKLEVKGKTVKCSDEIYLDIVTDRFAAYCFRAFKKLPEAKRQKVFSNINIATQAAGVLLDKWLTVEYPAVNLPDRDKHRIIEDAATYIIT